MFQSSPKASPFFKAVLIHLHHPPSSLHDTYSPNNLLHKPTLQSPHLPLKRLDLLPAIQRPSIINPQTPHEPILRLLHARILLDELLARIQLLLQALDLLQHAFAAERVRFRGGGSAVCAEGGGWG